MHRGNPPCPACLRAQEKADEAASIRAGLLSVSRLDQFYKDLLGPRDPGYEYQYEVTADSELMDIVLAVFKEILGGGEEYASFIDQLQGEGGWMEQLLNEAGIGMLDYGRRLSERAWFLDRIFAPPCSSSSIPAVMSMNTMTPNNGVWKTWLPASGLPAACAGSSLPAEHDDGEQTGRICRRP